MSIECPKCHRQCDTLDTQYIPHHAAPTTEKPCENGGAFLCRKCKQVSWPAGGREICGNCGTLAKR